MLGASRNVSLNDDKHISLKVLKIYRQGFFFILKICYWVLNNARGCNYTYKFHSNIHNKMDDNIGIALQHGTDFDIPKDRFCWIDMFISWFEDCQAWWFLFNLKLYASFKWKQKFCVFVFVLFLQFSSYTSSV